MAPPPVNRAIPYEPPPSLRGLVSGVAYEQRGFEAGIHRGLPSCALTVVIPLETPLHLVTNLAGHSASMSSCVGGLHDRPVVIGHDGTQVGFQLAVSPAGARALFGVPAAALAQVDVGLDDVWGAIGRELLDRMHDAGDWRRRTAILDEILGRVVAAAGDAGAAPDGVGEAWRRLSSGRADTTVGDVAREVGWSRRHLAQRFAGEIGMSPKTVARIARFQRAVSMLKAPAPARLANVAAAAGYADQAHMTREWQSLAGSSPASWLRAEAIPLLHDPDVRAA